MRRIVGVRVAKWRPRLPAHWPLWVKDWLSTRGSLSARLQRQCGQFDVQPVFQGIANAHVDELPCMASVPFGRMRRVRTRNVRLWAAGKEVVFAHTVVGIAQQRNDWPFWRGLGKTSLGTVLFKDKRVCRGVMEFARIAPGHPLFPRQVPSKLLGDVAPEHALYARRTRYHRGLGVTPLLVTELFLPTLQIISIVPPR